MMKQVFRFYYIHISICYMKHLQCVVRTFLEAF